jgi:hypothetical protein
VLWRARSLPFFEVLTPYGRFLAGHAERSVVVIDADLRVRYARTTPEHSIQPNYDAALAACRFGIRRTIKGRLL